MYACVCMYVCMYVGKYVCVCVCAVCVCAVCVCVIGDMICDTGGAVTGTQSVWYSVR